ncbi:MAG: hypothetical protein WED13_05220 [Methyloceanibacter sp.]
MSRPLVHSVFLFLLAASTSAHALEGDDVSTWSYNYGELFVLGAGTCDDYFFVNKQAAEAAQFEYSSAVFDRLGEQRAREELLEDFENFWTGQIGPAAKASGIEKENCESARDHLMKFHPDVFR